MKDNGSSDSCTLETIPLETGEIRDCTYAFSCHWFLADDCRRTRVNFKLKEAWDISHCSSSIQVEFHRLKISIQLEVT